MANLSFDNEQTQTSNVYDISVFNNDSIFAGVLGVFLSKVFELEPIVYTYNGVVPRHFAWLEGKWNTVR
jgi:hypothetical protein